MQTRQHRVNEYIKDRKKELNMKKRYKILLGIAGIIIMGLLIPYDFHNPVEGGHEE